MPFAKQAPNWEKILPGVPMTLRPLVDVGTCDFCGKECVGLVGALLADLDQRVCLTCHSDPRIPTVAT